MSLADELLARFQALPDAERAAIKADVMRATATRKFVPNTGPQTEAYCSLADELFYGGAAGSGKSSLLCGLAIEEHDNSIIFRREFPQIKGLVSECKRILGSTDGYNAQEKVWKLSGGRELEFGSVQHEDDKEKYQGRPHDLVGFDEITHFLESQYRFLIGWVRSSEAERRCRVVVAGNPPLTAEGAWVIKYWGPWLDPTYPRPAKPGELRWFTTVDGEDKEVDGPGPHLINDRLVTARSRTFIPGRLEDNPELLASGYAATLEAMPEPMRTMLREGRFDVGQRDADFQVIPTAWIVAAQARWKPDGHKHFAMTAMGYDPAGGGRDSAELCWRHGGWYAELQSKKGEETADGSAAAASIIRHRRDAAPVVVDVGGGYGGAVTLRLKDNAVAFSPFNGAGASTRTSKDGRLRFVNKRAEAWWRFREELDPDQQGGSAICLPQDTELRADLAAPTFEVTARGIQIESKDEIRKRLGRSPGKGDSVVMALSEGNAAVRRQLHGSTNRPATANLGYAHMKVRRA